MLASAQVASCSIGRLRAYSRIPIVMTTAMSQLKTKAVSR